MLWALAVVLPLLQILADSPDFFVARGNTRADIIVLTLALVVVPPTLLTVLEAAVWRAPKARAVLHLVLVTALAAAVWLQLLSSETSRASIVVVPAALLGGLLIGALYARTRFFPEMLTVMAGGVVLLPLWFLLLSPVSKLILPQETKASAAGIARSDTPVVFVVLDEFPTALLMRSDGTIDARRYPTFARFARQATWYRNATTVADQTTRALPAMLSGERPEKGDLPVAGDHPDNLFSLLGDSHRLQVTEVASDLCEQSCGAPDRPPATTRLRSLASDLRVVAERRVLPDDIDDRLPPVDQAFGGFDDKHGSGSASGGSGSAGAGEGIRASAFTNRRATLERFARGIKPRGGKPPLYFLHSVLPHLPAEYLPGARRYHLHGPGTPGLQNEVWGADPWLAVQATQRLALQIAAVDTLIGRLLSRLRRTGLYDRSLVVVVGDHGASYRPGLPRRAVTPRTVSDVAGVPLFIKAPGQRSGRIDDSAARTIDIIPTIAKLLRHRLGWRTEGRALPHARTPTIRVANSAGAITDIAVPEFLRRRSAWLRRQTRLFGAGLSSLYAAGPAADLVGSRAPATGNSAGGKAALDAPGDFAAVDTARGPVPAFITGSVERPRGAARTVAVAVGGRIRGTGRTYEQAGATRFSVMVAPASLRSGRNSVALYLVTGRRGARGLARMDLATIPSLRLAGRGGDRVIQGRGRTIRVVDDAAAGALDSANRVKASLEMVGWASDPQHRRPIRPILVFAGGKLVAAGRTGAERPDLVATFHNRGLARAGFRLEAPTSAVPPGARLEAFAVDGDRATKLADGRATE